MSSEWPLSELGKEAINASRPFPFKNHSQVVFVNTGDVLHGRFLHSNLSEAQGLPGQAKKALKQDDILLTEIRPGNGRFAFVNFPVEQYVVSTKFMVIESLGRVKPRFLYHVLTNQAALDEFQRIAESRSGTFPQITFESIEHFPVPVPPHHVQDELTQFFDGIDDRITLLRETNTTLEAIAQALFKSWFVDFDPVHAKMQCRAPEGMDEATAALFPDSFEESELGEVPKGWRVGIISDLGEVICGKTPPTSNPENYGDDVPFITIPDMHNRLVVTNTGRALSMAGANSQKKKNLPAGSICVSCIATPGLVVRVTRESQTNQQINSVVPRPDWGKSFPLFLLRRIGDAVRSAGSGGSVFHNLSKSGFEAIRVLLPCYELAQKFDGLVEPLIARIEANQQQAKNLVAIRDEMLPRLIKGQLQLPDVKLNVEEALG
jgi:type I restriction enzyme, S subunit